MFIAVRGARLLSTRRPCQTRFGRAPTAKCLRFALRRCPLPLKQVVDQPRNTTRQQSRIATVAARQNYLGSNHHYQHSAITTIHTNSTIMSRTLVRAQTARINKVIPDLFCWLRHHYIAIERKASENPFPDALLNPFPGEANCESLPYRTRLRTCCVCVRFGRIAFGARCYGGNRRGPSNSVPNAIRALDVQTCIK